MILAIYQKHLIFLGWRFSDSIDRAVDFTPRRIKVTNRFAHKEQGDKIFMWNSNLGKPTGRRENSLLQWTQ